MYNSLIRFFRANIYFFFLFFYMSEGVCVRAYAFYIYFAWEGNFLIRKSYNNHKNALVC